MDLGLKGNELMIYAIIYGFSQNNGNTFSGSLNYLQSFCGASRRTVITCLDLLVNRGLILRKDKTVKGVLSPEYCVNLQAISDAQEKEPTSTPGAKTAPPPRAETALPGAEIAPPPGAEIAPNIEYIDKEYIHKDNIPKSDDLGKSQKVNSKKEMPQSLYSGMVEFWLKEFKPGWTFTAVHGTKIKSLITKLKSVAKHKTGVAPGDLEILDAFKYLCQNLPEYYKDKDLPVIDSKFNEIVTEIKNNRNGTAAKISQRETTIRGTDSLVEFAKQMLANSRSDQSNQPGA